MTNKLAKYALGAYMLAVASFPIIQYVWEGKQTGEWNPIKQEWKATESLMKSIAISRNLPITEPRKLCKSIADTLRD